MLRILSIGNSCSQDAQHDLAQLAQAQGGALYCVNLYIGGCSIKQHWANAQQDAAAYDEEICGGVGQRRVSIREALEAEAWDVVTLQQASHDSGKPETYQPELTQLAAYVRCHAPGARLMLHQTWAYEIDSTHGAFPDYGCDQSTMYARLCEAYGQAARAINAPLIPVGDVIQRLRAMTPFDYPHGGLSLCRDGFHLSLNYGRYAAAATWLAVLTGEQPRHAGFLPEGCTEADTPLLELICKVAGETVFA